MTILEKRAKPKATMIRKLTNKHQKAAPGKSAKARKAAKPENNQLKGWAAIADFLKIPATTVQRWAKAGMPVQRDGRFTTANPEELLAWLGHEARLPRPAHIASNTADLMAGLKESIAAAKQRNNSNQ